MTSHSKFMAAILANPDEDAPRLIFADWLEEQGDSAKAEFIRDSIHLHANYTDCPVRLTDLGEGRPLPLRCGACDYCTRRIRAEKFYSKNQWLTGVPAYAVTFAPTPLDGAIPTGPGLVLVVSRGFVTEVICRSEDWCPRPCHHCGSGGSWLGNRGFPIPSDQGYTWPLGACRKCKELPGWGPVVVSQQPVVKVDLYNAHPAHDQAFGRPDRWRWFRRRERWYMVEPSPSAWDLPPVLWPHMPDWSFPGEAGEGEARQAANNAALVWARQAAGFHPDPKQYARPRRATLG